MSITLTVMAKNEKKKDIKLKYDLGAFGLTFLFLIFWAESFECQIALKPRVTF